MKPLRLTIGLLLVGACASSAPAAPERTSPAAPTLIFDTGPRPNFFDLPFPLDARRHPDGHPDLRGLPNPRGISFVELGVEASDLHCRGFAQSGVVSFRFTGPLPALAVDPLATTRSDAPIFLVDVAPGSPDFLRRQPVMLRQAARRDSVRPAHLLQILPVPGLLLRPSTTYAAVVLRDWGKGLAPLGAAPVIEALLGGRLGGFAGADDADALARAYAPLRAALPKLGLLPEEVAAATVFTTDDPAADMQAVVDWARAQPPLRVLELEAHKSEKDYTVLRGRVEVPIFQRGTPPHLLTGGEWVRDRRGEPVVQRTVPAVFELSVPHRPMPAEGFPLYFLVHGTGGSASQLSERGYRTSIKAAARPGSTQADLTADLGWGAASMDGPFSPNRIGWRALDGYAPYNFFRPLAMRGNFFQMMLEQVLFLKTVQALRIDPGLVPGADVSAVADGGIRFDSGLVVVAGQSLGAFLAGMLTATLDAFDGAVLSGAGGSWIEFAFGPKDPFDLQGFVELLFLGPDETLDRFHPYLTLFEMAEGSADNLHLTSQILRWRRPEEKAPHLLVIQGHVDLQVPTNLQRALVLSLGVDMLGMDVGEGSDNRLEPVLPLGGLRQLHDQAQGNVELASGERRTGVVVRYPEDGILEGHYVVYQHEQPRRQVAEFLLALQRGEAPRITDYSGDFAAESP